jgi:ribosomal protein S18 acetylase RimI-like enzyme
MQVRRMVARDLEAVRALHIELFPVRYAVDFFRDLIENPRDVALVLVDQQRVVGVATGRSGQKYLDWWGRVVHKMYIATFGVHASYQRQGHGKFLLRRFRDEVEAHHRVDCYVLHVKALNVAAYQFYLAQGFLTWNKVKSKIFAINDNHVLMFLQFLRNLVTTAFEVLATMQSRWVFH